MTQFRTLDDAALAGKRVLVRVDLNVPTENGQVTDDTRLERIGPTIRELADKGGKVDPAGAFRPAQGRPGRRRALQPIAAALAEVLGRPVAFARRLSARRPARRRRHAGRRRPAAGEHPLPRRRGEERPGLRRRAGGQRRPLRQRRLLRRPPGARLDRGPGPHAAGLCRAHHAGGARRARPRAGQPRAAGAAIVGGAKVSTKLDLLGNLVTKLDMLAIGGGMANTFLAAQGQAVGDSLCEKDLADTAREILAEAGCTASSCCRSTSWWPRSSRRRRPRAPSASTPSATDEHDPRRRAGNRRAPRGARWTSSKTLVWNGPFGRLRDAALRHAAPWRPPRHAAKLDQGGQAGGGGRRRRYRGGPERGRRRGRLHLRLHGRRRVP